MKIIISYVSFFSESKIGRYGIIFLIVFLFFFRYEISYNEMDVIPYAFSFFNKEWLPGDWYLNQSIPYRYLFNYPAGWMVDQLGFMGAIFLGRVISYALVSYAIYSLFNTLRGSQSNLFFLLALVIQFYFFSYGIGAGEWMIGGFDTKVFSYAFVLLSFNSLLVGKYKAEWLFGGMALSFHMLIGLYHLFCLIPGSVFLKKTDLLLQLRRLPYYLIGGAFGLYSVAFYLIDFEGALSNIGFDAYVNISVPHHTIPTNFPVKTWIFLSFFTCINFFVLKYKNIQLKKIAVYVLASVACFLFGLLVFYYAGPSHHLKYYFFRFSDVLLPFYTLVMLAAIADREIKMNSFISWGIMLFMGVLMLPKINHRMLSFSTCYEEMHLRNSQDMEMEQWIKKNTSKYQVFITRPDDMYFYINYERPVLVLTRHSPQSGEELIEWHQRLKLLNRGNDLESKEEVWNSYKHLTRSDLEKISRLYPEVSYLLMSKPIGLDLPICYQTADLVLYALDAEACL